MERPFQPPSGAEPDYGSRSLWPWLVAVGCLLVVLLGLLLPRSQNGPAKPLGSTNARPPGAGGDSGVFRRASSARHPAAASAPLSAEETVAAKLSRFAQSRRARSRAIAKQFKVELPADVERFFDAAEAGQWEELKALWSAIDAGRKSGNYSEGQSVALQAVHETYGAAKVAHDWPAQNLLDYGEAVLDSLRPGMVYVGGTDAGRFIPTLLNETSDGENHVVLTQNALADGTYIRYLGFLYGDQMATLTGDDSQQAFQDYMADAQKRLTHDQEFPQEPKQVRPGEDIQMTDGRVQVSGQVAVMAIAENLLNTLMQKNPSLSFALEESFPFTSTYPDAAPLGPIMELRTQDGPNTFTADAAAQALDYWRAATQQLLTGSEGAGDTTVLQEYSKLVATQARLLAAHNFDAEAEQAYRLAAEICPSSPEVVFRYVNLLLTQQRLADAVPVAEAAVNAAPDIQQFRDLLGALQKSVEGK